jgi:hypothetical protein
VRNEWRGCRRSGTVALALFVLAVSGCGASSPGTKATGPRAAPSSLKSSASAQPIGAPPQQIAYTAATTVRVRDVAKASAAAQDLVQAAGGLLFGETSEVQGSPTATLTFKVPPAKFKSVLSAFGRLGTTQSNSIAAEDVTSQVVDLNGRLKTAIASADRLRALMQRASGTSDIVAIETELEHRETEIESLSGQLRTLNGRVDMATVSLTLTERSTSHVSKNIPGFRRALHAGWVALINTGKIVVTVIGAVLPFAPFALLLLFALSRYRRWRRAHPRPARPTSEPWPARSPAYYPAPPAPGPSPGSGPGPTDETTV